MSVCVVACKLKFHALSTVGLKAMLTVFTNSYTSLSYFFSLMPDSLVGREVNFFRVTYVIKKNNRNDSFIYNIIFNTTTALTRRHSDTTRCWPSFGQSEARDARHSSGSFWSADEHQKATDVRCRSSRKGNTGATHAVLLSFFPKKVSTIPRTSIFCPIRSVL